MGERLNEYGSTNTSLTNIMAVLDAQRTGLHEVSLTEYTSTSRPLIAAGSYLEAAGALFEFSTNESVSSSGITSTAVMTYYIETIPTSSLVTVAFSSSAPVWRTDYNGFYRSTTSDNRFIQFGLSFDGTDYNDKFNFINYNNSVIRSYADSTFYSDDILCDNLISSDADIDVADIVDLNVTDAVSVGSSGMHFQNIYYSAQSQGGAGGALSVAYPAGFTQANTYVLSCLVASTNGWISPGYNGSTTDYRFELYSTYINLTHVVATQVTKLILARSSS